MKENEKESRLKKFIKDAFTSEAKASRIPYYFFAICILLTVICIELNTANRYLKRISSGGATYSFETNTKSNDPHEIFSEKTSEQPNEINSESKPSETEHTSAQTTERVTEISSDTAVTSKPQGNVRTYVINKNSKKVHYSTCSYAANMKEENKLTVQITYDELKNQYLSNGYTFCSKCGG